MLYSRNHRVKCLQNLSMLRLTESINLCFSQYFPNFASSNTTLFHSSARSFLKPEQLSSILSKIRVSRQLTWMQMIWTDPSGISASNNGFFNVWTVLSTKRLRKLMLKKYVTCSAYRRRRTRMLLIWRMEVKIVLEKGHSTTFCQL